MDRVISHQTITPTFSNHTLLLLTRRTKELKYFKNFILTRDFTNYSRATFQESLVNHPLYIETFYHMELETIAKNFQTNFRDSIDPIAPIKRVQLKRKKGANISNEARELMALRDSALQDYKKQKFGQSKTV